MLPRLFNSRVFPVFAKEFDEDNFLSDFFSGQQTGVNSPSVNVIENNDMFKIEVAAPGLEKNDFKIDVENDVLTISSEKEDEKEDKDTSYLRREFCYTCFKRSFTLPDSVNAEKIKASHKDGVLYVELPKKEEAKEKPPRKIEIS